MSDYSVTTDFSVKDGLTTGDPEKAISGADIDVEFEAIKTAVNSKVDDIDTLTAETAVAGDDEVAIYDTSATANRKMTVANLSLGMDYVLIGTATASADEYITFASIFDDTVYNTYLITISRCVPTTDGTYLMCQVGTGATPTWLAGTSYAFQWTGAVAGGETGPTATSDSSEDVMPIVSTTSGSAANEFTNCDIRIYQPGSAEHYYQMSRANGINAGGSLFDINMVGKADTSSTAVTSIRFMFGTWAGGDPAHSAETIASGEFRVYGLRNA